MKKLFVYSWKKLWIVVVGGFPPIVLHNVVSTIFKTEEAFFFILVIFVLPAYVILATTYTLIHKFKTKNKE